MCNVVHPSFLICFSITLILLTLCCHLKYQREKIEIKMLLSGSFCRLIAVGTGLGERIDSQCLLVHLSNFFIAIINMKSNRLQKILYKLLNVAIKSSISVQN
jgi:hypothetical protein